MTKANHHGAPERPLRVVGWLARAHGLSGLDALLGADRYEVVAVLTHKRLPRSQDPERSVRPTWADFEQRCRDAGVPLFAVDSRAEARQAFDAIAALDVDLFAVISWRRLIRAEQLAVPRLGGVNLHRGKLPEYAGAEPVRRALEDGRDEVEITAHVLVEEIDAGATLAIYRHPVVRDPARSVDEETERIKDELTPHFGPLLLDALDRLVESAHLTTASD